MSVFGLSETSSRVSSILKTPSIKSRLSTAKTQNKVRFQANLSKKISRILTQYLRGENVREYEHLVISIRDADLLDSEVTELLSQATKCISLLNRDLRLFVEAMLSMKWSHRSPDVISQYESFIVNLLSAHNYHAKYAVNKLVSNFIPEKDEEWENSMPSDEDCQKSVNIHAVCSKLLKVVPMCRELLLSSLHNHYPFYKKPTHIHECYLHNLLWMLDEHPYFRQDILNLIVSRLILLDVNAPKYEIKQAENYELPDESIFMMDVDYNSDNNRLRHPVGHTLDVCMDKLFNYFIMECHDSYTGELRWDKAKNLYQDLISVFDKVILPTYNIHHVQFIMFVLCSFKTTIAEAFLNYLWKKVCTPSTASVMRQSAVGYIASFIARATTIPLSMLKGTVQQMAEWVHSYINAQDELECVNADIRIHTVFYSVCQAIFYVIAFRQSDLVNNKKNIYFLESLNLGKIVTCRLNPLRVCQHAVVQNFAALARTYQLAYCYSVIEHNERNFIRTIYQSEKGPVIESDNMLEAFFPFDPYILKRSREKISTIYLNYQQSSDVKSRTSKQEFEDDDFLCDQEASNKGLAKFSYSSSPGFRI